MPNVRRFGSRPNEEMLTFHILIVPLLAIPAPIDTPLETGSRLTMSRPPMKNAFDCVMLMVLKKVENKQRNVKFNDAAPYFIHEL